MHIFLTHTKNCNPLSRKVKLFSKYYGKNDNSSRFICKLQRRARAHSEYAINLILYLFNTIAIARAECARIIKAMVN